MIDFIRIKHSPRAKRLALRLDTKERIFNLVVPKGVSEKRALHFARNYEAWMQEQLDKLPQATSFSHGAEIPVLGKIRRIHITKHDKRRTQIDLTPEHIMVETHLDDPAPRIQRFLKDHAQNTMEPLVQNKARQLGKAVHSVATKDMKSRWGSCSSDGKIVLSWRLILAPYEAMDYVIAHEVAHLQHLDHSQKFWACCASLCDDFDEGKYWMRHHGNELMGFGIC